MTPLCALPHYLRSTVSCIFCKGQTSWNFLFTFFYYSTDKQSFVKAELVKPTKVGSLFLKSIRRVYLCRKTSESFLFRWHRGITIFSKWVALSTVSGPLLNGEGAGDVSEQEGQSPGVRADNNYAYVSTWNCTINKYDSFIFLFHDSVVVVFVVCLCVYTARKQALSYLYSQVVARKSDKFTSVSWEANSSAQIFFLFTDIYFDLVKPKKK